MWTVTWRWIRITAVVGLAIMVVAVVIYWPPAIRDFRAVEADYIASRQPTACAIQGLRPLGFDPEFTVEKFNATLTRLVNDAAAESARVRGRFRARHFSSPYRPVRSAAAAVSAVLEQQGAFYSAIIADPNHSDAVLRKFAGANGRAERRIIAARRSLLLGEAKGWARRAVCRKDPEAVHLPGP